MNGNNEWPSLNHGAIRSSQGDDDQHIWLSKPVQDVQSLLDLARFLAITQNGSRMAHVAGRHILVVMD